MKTRARWGLAAVALLATACADDDVAHSDTIAERTAAPPVARPEIEVAGCLELQGQVCEMTAADRLLRLWVDVPPSTAVSIRVDDTAVTPDVVLADGGSHSHFEIPGDATSVTLDGVDPAWEQPYTLQIQSFKLPSVLKQSLKEASDGNLKAAAARLDKAIPALEPRARAIALLNRGRIAHKTGDPVGALRWMEASAKLARDNGLPNTAVRATTGAAFEKIEPLRDIPGARRLLDALPEDVVASPEAQVNLQYYNGLLARRVGDTSSALDLLARSRRGAERLGLFAEISIAADIYAATLAELGRADEARAVAAGVLDVAEREGLTCELLARLRGNHGWLQLVLAQGGYAHDPPEELFELALEAYAEGGACPDPSQAANNRLNLALAALHDNEPDLALDWLDRLRAELPPTHAGILVSNALYVEELEARAGLATGRWELVPSVVERPPTSGPVDMLWNARMRQAAILEAFGLTGPARSSYQEAEDLLEADASRLGLAPGWELFLTGRQASASGLVRLLLSRGDVDDALCTARLARGRSLRSLDRVSHVARAPSSARKAWSAAVFAFIAERDAMADDAASDWEFDADERQRRRARRKARARAAAASLDDAFGALETTYTAPSCGDLPLPPDGEALVVTFPTEEGHVLFLLDASGVAARRVDGPLTTRLVATVFETLAGRIARATRIRVAPTGAGWDISFAAVPWKDGVLIDAKPVVYTLDLARPPRAAANKHAVLVADPSADLPLAREEIAQVAEALRGAEWTSMQLAGPEVTRAKLRDDLAGASLLHYAGHGVHHGVTGWEASLRLADGDALAVADILALPGVPPSVVLSGCETGRVTTDALEGGMNLGRAFVLAGADQVIVADRKIPDALARSIGEGLYSTDSAALGRDLATRLADVQRHLRAEDATAGWDAFRVVVP